MVQIEYITSLQCTLTYTNRDVGQKTGFRYLPQLKNVTFKPFKANKLSIKFDTVKSRWSIVYIEGLQVETKHMHRLV